VSPQCILTVILFVIGNQNISYTGLNVHGLDIVNRNQLYIPCANVSSLQKVVTYSEIWIFNISSSTIQHFGQHDMRSKNKLSQYIVTNSLYLVTEFLKHSTYWKTE